MKPGEWRPVRYATGLSSAWIVLYAVRQVDLLMTALLVSTYLGLMTYGLVVPRVRRKLKDRRQQAIRTRAAATLFDWDDLGSTERVRIKLQAGMLTLNDARERVAEIQAAQGYGPSVVTPVQKSEPLPLCAVPPVSAGGPGPTWLTEPAEYVPDGQAELNKMLLEYLNDQVHDAASRWVALRDPLPEYHWEMNAEWRNEVKRMADKNGRQYWEKPAYPDTLYGYPVKVSDTYGAPNLVAS
jgi:hypothetical protein